MNHRWALWSLSDPHTAVLLEHSGLWLEGLVAWSENLGSGGFIWEVILGEAVEERKWEKEELMERASLTLLWAAGAWPCWEPLTGGGDTLRCPRGPGGRAHQVRRTLPRCRGESSRGCWWGALMLQQLCLSLACS